MGSAALAASLAGSVRVADEAAGRRAPVDWARLASLRVPARALAHLAEIAQVPVIVMDRDGRERGRYGPDGDARSGRHPPWARSEPAGRPAPLSVLKSISVPIVASGETVGALVTGALAQPERLESVRVLLHIAAEEMGLFLEDSTETLRRLRAAVEPILGASPAIGRVIEAIALAGRTDRPVLISGETGTGKELVATAIHAASPRRHKRLVALNCASPAESLLETELFGHARGAFTGAVGAREGLIAEAAGGTLFLDEVPSMSPGLQAKLLRVLETGTFRRVGSDREVRSEARVIAAANEDLHARALSGAFRKDLLYRLDVLRIAIPPLRERSEDIPQLAEAFARRVAREENLPPKRLAGDALGALAAHAWPGNVRELLHVLTRAVLESRSDRIRATDLRIAGAAGAAAGDGDGDGDAALALPFRKRKRLVMEAWERDELRRGLERHAGNRSALARELGMGRPRLIARLKALAIG